MSATVSTPPASALITPDQTSAALGVSLAELSDMRTANLGPKFHRVGFGLVRYNTADMVRWQSVRATP